MLPGPLQAGDLLAERYLLLDPVASDGPTVLWRAQDQVLARDVAVRVLPTPNKASRAQAALFLEAATYAGKVAHPGLVRVLDAGEETRPGRAADVTYLIREWVEGEPLDEHVTRLGALAPPDASDVLRQIADALAAAHAGGIAHGRLHPRNILVTPGGRIRITDAVVAAVVHGDALPAPVNPLLVSADTRDAAAVLYALLTARWPSGATPLPHGDLLLAPLTHGHPMDTHQVRAGVPRALDHVVTRALDPARIPTLPPIRTPAALADAADASVADLRRERIAAAAPRPPGFARRHALLLSGTAVVVAFAVSGWYLGLAIGELPRRAGGVDALVATPQPSIPGTSAAPALSLSRVPLRDFDPLGDGEENPDQVRNATDGDPTTAWTTSRYRSAGFSGLKSGVGLLLDLGTVRPVHQLQVGFTAPGANVQLRVADTLPATDAATRVVATSTAGKQVADLRAPTGTVARYLLVWITELPKEGSGWRVGVAELHLT